MRKDKNIIIKVYKSKVENFDFSQEYLLNLDPIFNKDAKISYIQLWKDKKINI